MAKVFFPVKSRVHVSPRLCDDDFIVGTVVDGDAHFVAVEWDSVRDMVPGSKAGTTTVEPVNTVRKA